MSRTILVIEDNPEERRIFSTYLQFVGGDVLEADNGDAGLHMARKHRPDLILMDLSMPVADGWEAMRRLEGDPATSGIPVLAVTAHHLPPNLLEDAGFCGYLEKPISPHRVLEEVERCIGPIHQDDEPAEEGQFPLEVPCPTGTRAAAGLLAALPDERPTRRRRHVRSRPIAAGGRVSSPAR